MNLVWKNCSETRLDEKIREWAGGRSLKDAIVFLHGDMGAGKSTFVRSLLAVLCPDQLSKGSPTFPLVTEYRADADHPVYHIDLYRLKNEDELHHSGIEAQIEEPGAFACVEWSELFPDAFAHWYEARGRARKQVIDVWLKPASDEDPDHRDVEIRTPG